MADVYYADSTDDGSTWWPPVSVLTGCTHPACAVSPAGDVMFMGYSGGNLKACVQGIGDTAPSTPVTVKDQTGAALVVTDDSFGLCYSHSGQGGWVLHVLISGDMATSEWICYSEQELSFKKLT